MDPISIIVTALATGAAAGLKPAAEKFIKDAYAGIKAIIQRKYERVSIDMLENDPASESRQSIVKQDLEKVGASNDKELLSQAKVVLDSILRYDPQVAETVGVDLEDIKGASLKIDDIVASGTGVKIKKADIGGDIEIKGVRAGKQKDSSNPSMRQ